MADSPYDPDAWNAIREQLDYTDPRPDWMRS